MAHEHRWLCDVRNVFTRGRLGLTGLATRENTVVDTQMDTGVSTSEPLLDATR